VTGAYVLEFMQTGASLIDLPAPEATR